MIVPVETQNDVSSCVNTTYVVEKGIKPCHLLLFDSASDMIDEKNMKATTTLISMGGVDDPKKIVTILFFPPIHIRDERAPKVRLREELAAECGIESIRIALFVPRHISEAPFTLGLDFDLPQFDVTVSVEGHYELPAWDKVCHHE